MAQWTYTTITSAESAAPSQAQVAALLLDLYHHAIIDTRFTLFSSPDAEVSRSGKCIGFPWPDELELDLDWPVRAAGTVVGDWFDIPDAAHDRLIKGPAKVHYDGADLDGLLRVLPHAGVGTADVFMVAHSGPAFNPEPSWFSIAEAVGVAVLAAPMTMLDVEGWYAWGDPPPPDLSDDELEPLASSGVFEYPVQWSFNTWSSSGMNLDHVAPLSDVLHRHLGADLMVSARII